MTLEEVQILYNCTYKAAEEMVTLLREKQEQVRSSEYDVLEKINEYVNEYMRPYTPVLITDPYERNISVTIPYGNQRCAVRNLHCSLVYFDDLNDGHWVFKGDKNYNVQPIDIIKNWSALKVQMKEKVKSHVNHMMQKLKEKQEEIAESETIIKEFVI